VDADSVESAALEAYRLGLGDVIAISAEQGRGIDTLMDRLRESLPAGETAAEEGVPIAIVGRPNVGKSSLFNRFVGEDRVLVTSIPGTTRDPVDALFEHAGTRYRVIDTAGIRRRSGRGEDVERVSVQKAREALERAQAAVAIVDGHAGIEHQDLAILGLVAAARVPAVVAANKWDLLAGGPAGVAAERLRDLHDALRFAPHLPVVPISALTGKGVADLLDVVARVRAESARRFKTPELNRVLQAVIAEKQPPSDGGRDVRMYYATQMSGVPPRFVIFTNGRRVKPSYRRFVEGRLRRHLGLAMTPLALAFRRRSSR
jgi:GTP-binding protein